ncbi:MAG: DNA primase [Candidatus Doudnabacteria bacterium]
MRSSNSTISEIKDKLNIVDVLSSYIQLKKSGTNLKAPCPFHHEKTASFMVSPSKQIWHCFGCGEGGDIFGFVMKYENIEFPEALKVLAEKAGVELPKFTAENVEQNKYQSTLLKINEWTAKYYNQVLEKSSVAQPAREYLNKRGLSAQTLADWQIGFAPNEFHLLEDFLLKKGYTHKELQDAGVISKSTRGDYFDRFFNRITFPIKNYSGDVVGFTARTMDSDAKTAKYINTSETAIYNKSKIIFGLYQAKQQIRKEDFAIIVEGNMDVITAHQAGFKNVVASSGTAFTFDQLQTLSRLTKNLKFSFDTDAAGVAATRRTLDLALQQGFSVYIVKISGAKDPDELIKKDPKLFAKAIEDAPLYLDYFFEKAFLNYDPSSVQQKKQIAADLLPLIKQLSDPLEIEHYTRMLAQRLNVTEKTIYEIIAKIKNGKANNPTQTTTKTSAPLLKPKTFLLEQRLLGYALFDPQYLKDISKETTLDDFKDPGIKEVLELLLKQNIDQSSEEFINTLKDQELAKIAVFMVESEYHQLDNPAVFKQEFRKLLRDFVANNTKIAMNSVIAEMALAEQKKDKQKLKELNEKFLELSKNLNRI